MTTKPQPLNFKLARITPKWAFKQSARRWLVVLFFLVPFVAGTAAGYLNSLWSLLFAPFAIFPILCFIWLVGATGARADAPNEYLDEREIAVRNETYLNAFRILGAIIALGYTVLTLFPDLPITAKSVLAILFPITLLLPTFTLAWTQPDPLEEACA
jgi:hypothetical protein